MKIEIEIGDGHKTALEIIMSEYYPHADGRNLGPLFEIMIEEYLERENGRFGTIVNGKWIKEDKK